MNVKNLQQAFWSKIDRRGDGECWNWMGYVNGNGYGHVNRNNIHTRLVHRIMWMLKIGQIPDGFLVLHRCDNRRCVNIAHLFLGTHADNTADCVAKGRHAAGQRNGRAKLSPQEVQEIRDIYAAGAITKTALAAQFGVTNALVGKIVRRELWASAGRLPAK